ncbi:response regulator transcription factor [Paraferrimonas haliotis]|uniref:Helix-turn-helix transcriptional regulator n=1 Tax=Paraferrimonas haliotis TaxID=2013866 RepID=A0AA37TKD0_9GAMM|nr:response regulator transcription factor [Paraferrimonas haliotis]GLS83047.1 helix-turn-helix transcriptional regulator [Paraferrimonas haliotis]
MSEEKHLLLLQPQKQACTLSAIAQRAGYRVVIEDDPQHFPNPNKLSGQIIYMVSCREVQSATQGIPDVVNQLLVSGFSQSRIRVALYQAPTGEVNESLAMLMGLQGVYYDHHPLDRLLIGLAKMLAGELWFSSSVVGQLCQQLIFEQARNQVDPQQLQLVDSLTLKERKVITLVCSGARNKEIARQLYISEHTVKSHISAIYRKTQVRNRVALHRWASQHQALLTTAS